MKKKLFAFTLFLLFFGLKAQYASLNEILNRLEERRGIKQDLQNINLDDTKFVLIKDFADHTERNFIVLKGNKATYVEMFDDKSNGETTCANTERSNVSSTPSLQRPESSIRP